MNSIDELFYIIDTLEEKGLKRKEEVLNRISYCLEDINNDIDFPVYWQRLLDIFCQTGIFGEEVSKKCFYPGNEPIFSMDELKHGIFYVHYIHRTESVQFVIGIDFIQKQIIVQDNKYHKQKAFEFNSILAFNTYLDARIYEATKLEKTKRNHIIPQFYTEGFSIDRKKASVFYKNRKEVLCGNHATHFVGNNIYDFSFEKYLGSIESGIGKMLFKLKKEKNNRLPIYLSYSDELLKFLITYGYRTSHLRNGEYLNMNDFDGANHIEDRFTNLKNIGISLQAIIVKFPKINGSFISGNKPFFTINDITYFPFDSKTIIFYRKKNNEDCSPIVYYEKDITLDTINEINFLINHYSEDFIFGIPRIVEDFSKKPLSSIYPSFERDLISEILSEDEISYLF